MNIAALLAGIVLCCVLLALCTWIGLNLAEAAMYFRCADLGYVGEVNNTIASCAKFVR